MPTLKVEAVRPLMVTLACAVVNVPAAGGSILISVDPDRRTPQVGFPGTKVGDTEAASAAEGPWAAAASSDSVRAVVRIVRTRRFSCLVMALAAPRLSIRRAGAGNEPVQPLGRD